MAELYKNVINKNPTNVLEDLKAKNGVQQTYTFNEQDFQKKTINSLTLFNGQFLNCNFTVSQIGGCTFENCEFVKCKFNNVTLLGVKFKNCIIDHCDFSEALMQDVVFLDNIMTANIFNKVQIKYNVTINGTDIVDGKQLELTIGDNTNDIITDDINDKDVNMKDILDKIKPLEPSGDGSWDIVRGNIVLCIYEDQVGWRVTMGYYKDGQLDDSLITHDIITKQEEDNGEWTFYSKQEILDEIYDVIKDTCQDSKNRVSTDLVKKNIDDIAKQFESGKPTIEQSTENLSIRLKQLIKQNKQLKQYIKSKFIKSNKKIIKEDNDDLSENSTDQIENALDLIQIDVDNAINKLKELGFVDGDKQQELQQYVNESFSYIDYDDVLMTYKLALIVESLGLSIEDEAVYE